MNSKKLGVWFPAVKCGTGTDVFTITLAEELNKLGFRAEITWLPHHAEFLPWGVKRPEPPSWANIIHINSWLHPRFYQSFGLPVVVTCHGSVHDRALSPYKTLLQKIYHQVWIKSLESRAYQNCAYITAVSEYTARITREAFGDIAIHTIPNWLPNKAFSTDEKSSVHQPFRLLFLGRLSKRKGADLLAPIMHGLGNDFELYYTVHPEDKAGDSHHSENMKRLGWTSSSNQINEWIDNADALIFPSRMEGMPLAVLESMARGLPVICSNSSSLPELIQHSIHGLICPVDNVTSFIEAAQYLLQNPEACKAMSVAVKKRALIHYSQDSSISKYINIYQSLI